MIDIQPEDQAVFDRLKSTGRISHALRRLITQRWNYCSACDHLIFRGRPAFAGYDAQQAPLFVGACCADRLQELASPIYWDGSLNLAVEDEQPLWRYMDFAKFVSLLRQGGLYFPRADKLEDPFEGAVGLARREEAWDRHYVQFFREAVTTAPVGHPVPRLSEDRIEAEARRLLREFKQGASLTRSLLVNCWHANTVESEALWRLYCPPSTMGVAIRTSAGALWDATASEAGAVVGRVHYIDFRRSFAHQGNQRIFCKRLSLSHEREVRAILQNDLSSPVEGKVVVCDLGSLIDEVVTSPFAPTWFGGVVADVIAKFDFSLKLRPSELLDAPFY